jgi:hypothetical protein
MKDLNFYITKVFASIVTPKEGEYYLYKDNLLKIVSANDCERCFFYPNGYCKLMFLKKGNIHCDYDSHINFLDLKKIFDIKP